MSYQLNDEVIYKGIICFIEKIIDANSVKIRPFDIIDEAWLQETSKEKNYYFYLICNVNELAPITEMSESLYL